MWKEITKENIDEKEINKGAYILNTSGCIANIKQLDNNFFKIVLERKDASLFIYKDSKFEIVFLVMYNKNYDKIKLLHTAIKWDFTDKDIDPLEGAKIFGYKLKEYMKRYNVPGYFLPIQDENIPFNHIFLWWKRLVKVFERLGIKTTIEKDTYREFELI